MKEGIVLTNLASLYCGFGIIGIQAIRFYYFVVVGKKFYGRFKKKCVGNIIRVTWNNDNKVCM